MTEKQYTKIGARVYGISIESPEINKVFQENDTAYGYIDYVSGKIKLRSDISKDFQTETLLHELLHAMLDNSGIEDINLDKITKVLAPRLHALLIDNPTFQEDILKDKE